MSLKVREALDKWIKRRLDIEKEFIYAKSPFMERINAREEKRQSSDSRDARKDKG